MWKFTYADRATPGIKELIAHIRCIISLYGVFYKLLDFLKNNMIWEKSFVGNVIVYKTDMFFLIKLNTHMYWTKLTIAVHVSNVYLIKCVSIC